jgi:hypothetical protein
MRAGSIWFAAAIVAVLAGTSGLHAQAGEQNAFFAGPGTHGALLNGAPLLPGTAVMAGETITTGPGGVAILAPTHGSGGVLELTANAIATVHTGILNSAVATDQLNVSRGDVMATGNVSVNTPQGQTFHATNSNTTYMLNVDQEKSSMGVLRGSVATFNATQPSEATTVPAGNAVQVNTSMNGQAQLSNIKMNQVTKPAVSAAVPQTVTASQSGG